MSFGDGIDYREVTASEDHQESCLVGEIKPLEIIHLGKTDSQQSLVGPTVGKVIHLLDNVRLMDNEVDNYLNLNGISDPRLKTQLLEDVLAG